MQRDNPEPSSRPPTTARSLTATLADVAAQHAGRSAIADWTTSRPLTYAQVWTSARHLTAQLAFQTNPVPEVCAILLPTDSSHLIAVIGTLLAGQVWLSLDPAYPDERLALMLAETRPAVIITNADLAARATRLQAGTRILRWTPDLAPSSPPELPPPPADPWRPAAIFFTSGSTGRPKSAVHTHASIQADISRQTRDLTITPEDRFDLLFSASFSAFLSPVFGALLTGASVHIFPLRLKSAAALRDWLTSQAITVSTMSVSGYRRLLAEVHAPSFPAMRIISVGAEPLARSDYVAFSRYFQSTCLLQNALATTETRTIAQDCHPASSPPPDQVACGRPVSGKTITLLDSAGQPVAPGQAGDIVVTSECISPGNWSFFCDLPGRSLGGPRRTVHRTGDLGRFLPDGRLVHLGRIDSQLKIRGHRVEALEVEGALLRQPGVVDAAVCTAPGPNGSVVLACLLVASGQQAPAPALLRAALARELPDYAVPSRYLFVSSLPLTSSGKLDRRALPAALARESVQPHHIGGAEDTTDDLLALVLKHWREAVGSHLGPDDEFFAHGGDSLSAVAAMTALGAVLGRPLSPGLLIEHPIARALAARIELGDDSNFVTFLPLRHGHAERPPVYLLPPWNQSCTLFRDLARTSPDPDAGPWIGLEAARRPENSDLDSIEAIAAQILPALVARHPDSPFILAGFSAGGFVAWELGRRLEAAGRKDIRVVLLDCPRVYAWLDDAAAKATARDHRPLAKIRHLTAHIINPCGLHRRDMIVELLFGKLSWWLYRRRRHLRRPPDPYADAYLANILVSKNYRLAPLSLPVGILRGRYQADWTARFQIDLGWSPYCRGPVRLREINRGHLDMMFAPAATHTARLIEELIDPPDDCAAPSA